MVQFCNDVLLVHLFSSIIDPKQPLFDHNYLPIANRTKHIHVSCKPAVHTAYRQIDYKITHIDYNAHGMHL